MNVVGDFCLLEVLFDRSDLLRVLDPDLLRDELSVVKRVVRIRLAR